MKSHLLQMLLASGSSIKNKFRSPPAYKPVFTSEELEHVRSLSKNEKTRAVRELQSKYFKEHREKKGGE